MISQWRLKGWAGASYVESQAHEKACAKALRLHGFHTSNSQQGNQLVDQRERERERGWREEGGGKRLKRRLKSDLRAVEILMGN